MIALGARRGGEDRVREARELAHRAVELRQVGEEDEQAAEREAPLRERPGAEREDDERAEQLDQVDERREQPADPRRGQLGLEDPLVLARGSARPRRPGGRAPARASAFARLSSATALIEPLRRRFSRDACLISREKRRATPEEQRRRRAHERQLPLEVEQRGAEERRSEAARRGRRRSRRARTSRSLHVAGEPRDHVAEAAARREKSSESPCTCAKSPSAGAAGSARRPRSAR